MPIITCPNCKSLLQKSEKEMRCQNAHTFDIAKEGYINLLLSNQKKSINPGDNKLMINAREEFLSKGHFNFLLDQMELTVNATNLFKKDKNPRLLDLGCGTGFYTRNLFKNGNLNKIGIDISKTGIAKAAKKDNNSIYLVGSVIDLTIADNSVDIIINVFSPIHLEEVQRVLKPGGIYIKVIPSGNHMKEIASLVYETFTPHQSDIESDINEIPDFKILKVEDLQKEILLNPEDLRSFIFMTPYLYRFSESQLESLKELSVTTSFKIITAQCG